jgi:hypothetical protein
MVSDGRGMSKVRERADKAGRKFSGKRQFIERQFIGPEKIL